MSKRILDRIAALEAALAPPQARVSLCAPVPDLTLEEWEQVAMKQQAYLIATGKADVDRAAAREAQRIAEHAAEATPQRKQSSKHAPTPFVHVPSLFDIHSRA
ncbi:MAG: hypothetical protein ABL956_13075 [Hyphomonadaceae bacterium]